MKKILILLSVTLYGCSIQSVYVKSGIDQFIPKATTDSITHSIFLIGDAGEPMSEEKEKILPILTREASKDPFKSTILFLGDNIYPAGLPDVGHKNRKEMERRLDEQIAVGVKSRASTIFIPGNHDWDRQGKNGLTAIRRVEKYILENRVPQVIMLPSDGFPGPSFIDINEDLRIIIIDTQWWLHEYEKPLYPTARTEEECKKLFLDSLVFLLRTTRTTIVAAHHPLESHGEHGGFFDWRDHLFPLRHFSDYLWIPFPGIGSLYPLSRMLGITQQDFSGSRYRELRFRLDSVLTMNPPLAYVSGHEHSLQILEPRSGFHYLVSGFGMENHISPLSTGDNTIFARLAPGFMRIDLFKNADVHVRVFEAGKNNKGREIFSKKLR